MTRYTPRQAVIKPALLTDIASSLLLEESMRQTKGSVGCTKGNAQREMIPLTIYLRHHQRSIQAWQHLCAPISNISVPTKQKEMLVLPFLKIRTIAPRTKMIVSGLQRMALSLKKVHVQKGAFQLALFLLTRYTLRQLVIKPVLLTDTASSLLSEDHSRQTKTNANFLKNHAQRKVTTLTICSRQRQRSTQAEQHLCALTNNP